MSLSDSQKKIELLNKFLVITFLVQCDTILGHIKRHYHYFVLKTNTTNDLACCHWRSCINPASTNTNTIMPSQFSNMDDPQEQESSNTIASTGPDGLYAAKDFAECRHGRVIHRLHMIPTDSQYCVHIIDDSDGNVAHFFFELNSNQLNCCLL